MKKIRWFSAFFVFPAAAALLCGCPQSNLPENPYWTRNPEPFFAQDFRTGQSYSLDAVELVKRPGSDGALGVVVYGERSAEVSAKVSLETAEAIADEFEAHILRLVSSVFGKPLDYNEDGMITLLLLDVRDGAVDNGPYTAGYFTPNDMSLNKYSNKMDMLYLDVVQGGPEREDFYATIAHELQHLIRYSDYLAIESRPYPDTWLNEGLSLAAEYVYWNERKGTAVLDDYYVDSFNGKDRQSNIPQGNNFFVWSSDDYVLDEYATAYLFFRWLRIQAGNNTAIYEDIIRSINAGKDDSQAVQEAAAKHINPGPASWEALIRSWLLANYVKAANKNEAKGLYGYDGQFSNLKSTASGEKELRLYPGEGVYSILQDGKAFTPGQSGRNIRYVGVTGDGTLDTEPAYTGTRLLTFNSSNIQAGSELGRLTGSGDTPASGPGPRQSSSSHLPYRIDVPPVLPPAAGSPGGDLPGQ
ncbi:MAG: hypothetical protein LBP93_04590 [Treponema sp.]|nr:hypothetical protein [Treponema sp.]